MKTLYTATVTAHGGRDGHVRSSDDEIDMALAVPRGLGGAGGEGSNPEQLFAAAYAACFEGAVRYVAQQREVKLEDASVTAHVGIGPRQPTGFGLTVRLEVSLPGIEAGVAKTLVDEAHADICPYSHATRGNVDVDIVIV